MRTPRLPAVHWTDAPRWFKRTRPFCRKTKSGFCTCAITFQTQSTTNITNLRNILLDYFWFTHEYINPSMTYICILKRRGLGGGRGTLEIHCIYLVKIKIMHFKDMLNNLFYFPQNVTAIPSHNFILSRSNNTFFTNHTLKFKYRHGRLQVKKKTSCNYWKCFYLSCLIIGEPPHHTMECLKQKQLHTQEMQITTKFYLYLPLTSSCWICHHRHHCY